MPFVVIGRFDFSPLVIILAVEIITALLGQLSFDLAGLTVRGLGA